MTKPSTRVKPSSARVQFCEDVTCVGMMRHDVNANDCCNQDMVEDETMRTSSLWHTRAEFRRIRRRTAKQADRIEAMQNDDDIQKRLLVRNIIGLESNRDRAQRRNRVRNSTLAVLLPQEHQWEERKPQDPALLAQVYAKCSRISSQRARNIGIDCAAQVQQYQHLSLSTQSNQHIIGVLLLSSSIKAKNG
jgi:hypothetical protein